MNKLAKFVVLVVALACLSISCTPPEENIDRVLSRIDETIAALDRNSADWQNLLRDLMADLQGLESSAANDVDNIIRRATGTVSVEFRCNVEFVGDQVEQDLQRLADRLRGNTPQPPTPVVCETFFVPNQYSSMLEMAARPTEIQFQGYNFDMAAPGGMQVVLRHSQGEISLTRWVAQPTHYLISLNTSYNPDSPEQSIPLCNLIDRKIVLRLNDRDLYSVNVNSAACPQAPTPLPEKLSSEHFSEMTGTAWNDHSEDREFGGACDSGYQRSTFRVVQTENNAGGSCSSGEWASGDQSNCKIKVHFSVPHVCDTWPINCPPGHPLPNSYVKCKIQIYEIGIPQPTPPCTCK